MRRGAGLILLALCVALVGCGEKSQDEKLSGELGGEGKQDAARLNDFMKTTRRATEADIAVLKAVNQGDIEAARTANDDLHKAAADDMAVARDVTGEKLRTFLVDYSQAIGDIADRYQALFAAPARTPDAEIAKLVKRVRRAKQHAKQLDDRFVAVVKDVLPPDEYADFRRYMKQQQDRYNAQTGGG
jgi:hypothetical protein